MFLAIFLCRFRGEIQSATIITKSELRLYAKEKNGAGEETRTLDSHLGKVMLYQLSYTRSIKDLRP